jgi:hypothetical protein
MTLPSKPNLNLSLLCVVTLSVRMFLCVTRSEHCLQIKNMIRKRRRSGRKR